MTKRQQLLLLFIACGLCIVIGVYYLVPGIWHPLTFDGSPTDSRFKHALLFFGLAVLGLIASRFLVGRSSPRS